MKLKYIVDEANGFSIFPGYIFHDDIARQHTAKGFGIIGAGFIDISCGEVHCYGKSTSLNIVSRGEEDAKVIIAAFDLLPIE